MLKNRTNVRILGLWAVVFFVAGITLYGNWRAAQCEKQFQAAITYRAQYTEQADRFEEAQRQAMMSWVYAFSHPPPGADSYGPERMQWLAGVSDETLTRFNSLNKLHSEILAKRAQTPVPAITCGV